jgi:shikimate kinase
VLVKQNICVIGLNNKYVATIGKSIADAFDMFFADITELIKFELMDVEYARAVCGDGYIHKVERSKVKAVNTFENTLFTMDYSLLNDDFNLKFTQDNSFIIYLKLSKEEIDKIADKDSVSGIIFDIYEFRDKLCEKYCDFVINCDGEEESQIIKMIQQKFIEISG